MASIWSDRQVEAVRAPVLRGSGSRAWCPPIVRVVTPSKRATPCWRWTTKLPGLEVVEEPVGGPGPRPGPAVRHAAGR